MGKSDSLTLFSPFLCFLRLCELRYGLFHGIVCYMNIAVHSGRDTGVTQQLLQELKGREVETRVELGYQVSMRESTKT